MTDATDIKALREACEILNDHGYMPESGEIRSSNLAEAVRMIIKQSVGYADQLEAERQRTEKARERLGLDVAWQQRALVAEKEIAALKAKLANPVVLPARCTPRVGGDYELELISGLGGELLVASDVISALHAAGFTVKGE